MAEVQDIIKKLVAQCNIEAISTKDLAAELSSLYTKVQSLESSVTILREENKNLAIEKVKAVDQLNDYKARFVLPVERIAEDRRKLEEEKFCFEIEKKYMVREVQVYQEILKSLTASRNFNQNYSSSEYNGSGNTNWSAGYVSDKPQLPPPMVNGLNKDQTGKNS